MMGKYVVSLNEFIANQQQQANYTRSLIRDKKIDYPLINSTIVAVALIVGARIITGTSKNSQKTYLKCEVIKSKRFNLNRFFVWLEMI